MPKLPDSDWRLLATQLFAFHDQVVERVGRSRSLKDREVLHDAFIQAVLEISQEPHKFDPTRGNIVDFLAGAASRCLRTPLRSDQARRRREEQKGKLDVAAKRSAAREILDELADADLAEIARHHAARTPEEGIVLRLWEQGIEDISQYVQELGIQHLPEGDQRAQVTKIRNRVTARLRRLNDRWSNEEIDP